MAARRNARGQFVKGSGGRKRRRSTSRKRRRRSAPRAAAAAPRRRRRRATTAAPRRRRRYRRNPPSGRAMMRTLVDGAKGAAGVLAGEAAMNTLPGLVRVLPTTGPLGILVQVGTALVVGVAAQRVAPKWAPFVTAGALAVPLRQAAKRAPMIGPALSAYVQGPRRTAAIGDGGMGSAGMAAYVQQGSHA